MANWLSVLIALTTFDIRHMALDYFSTITGLYSLVIGTDGNITEKELTLGRKMVKAEGFDEAKFDSMLSEFKAFDKAKLLKGCIAGLKNLVPAKQLRCISWMCVIANSDGFMDKREWELIYTIYHKELNLSLDDIMKTQRELNKILHGKEFLSFGIKTG
ncbi:MAG: TerB family tellurite resistance protein [Cytophagales bacterium]